MKGKIVGLTILGVLSYMIFKHFKKPATTKTVPTYISVEIDPQIYESKPVPTPTLAKGYISELNPVYIRTTYKAPYNMNGFGMDSARNTDSIDPDSYLHMPLESEGITHINKDLYKDIDEEPFYEPTLFKYIRIKFKGLRSSDSSSLSLGGIRFLMSREPIKSSIQLWNPHTGAKSTYSGEGLKDSDQMTFVFIFSEPTQLNRYELKTSLESADMDPSSWILEGSMNGSYWVLLDNRPKISLPLERNKIIGYYMQNK
jgi:hypothetical protein